MKFIENFRNFFTSFDVFDLCFGEGLRFQDGFTGLIDIIRLFICLGLVFDLVGSQDGTVVEMVGFLIFTIIELQILQVTIKSQLFHCVNKVISVYCSSFVGSTFLAGLSCNEGYKIWDALLNSFTSIFGDFCFLVFGQRLFHNSANIRDRQEPILVLISFFGIDYLLLFFIFHFLYNTILIFKFIKLFIL